MIKNYFKIAFRILVKQKLYSSINISGMAIGMATAVLLVLWVYNEYTYDHFHKNAKDIYRVTSHIKINKDETWHWGSTPLLLAEKLKANFPEIKQTALMYIPWGEVTLKVKNNLLSVDKLAYVDKNWFDIFDYNVIKGSINDLKSDKYNIAITENKAKELFGNENPLDQIIQIDSMNLVVKTVLAENPPNTTFKYQILVQNETRLTDKQTFENENNWGNFNYQTFVLCNNKVNTQNLENKITAMFQDIREDSLGKNTLKLQALTELHFDESIQIGELLPPISKSVLGLFAGIALLILVTACINYINLTTATLSFRNKEISIRKFMGSSKKSLFFQFFMASSFLSILAMGFSIVIIYLSLPLLESIADTSFNIANNFLVWYILGGMTFITILINGIYPSLLLANLKPLELIKGNSIVGTKNAIFRKSLVVFQFSFSIALLICTFLIFNQLKFMQTKDLGYQKDQVFNIEIPWFADQSGDKINSIVNQLQSESQIKEITKSSGDIVNYSNNSSGSLDWAGKDEDWNPTVSPMSVSNNYQAFFDLVLTEGRWFDMENASDDNNLILNETAIKEFKLQPPYIGQIITFQERKGQIIGIAKDFHFRSPREKITPFLFYRDDSQRTINIKANASNVSSAIATVHRIWKSTFPNLPFKYAFLDDTYAKLQVSESKQLKLFYSFGCIVLLLSCIGLFGLATFAAEVRTKEIGIRKVLGVSLMGIVQLLSKDFIVILFIAFLVASPIAYLVLTNWLQDFAFHVEITLTTFLYPAIFVATLALITVSYQALKAALINPVESLKSE